MLEKRATKDNKMEKLMIKRCIEHKPATQEKVDPTSQGSWSANCAFPIFPSCFSYTNTTKLLTSLIFNKVYKYTRIKLERIQNNNNHKIIFDKNKKINKKNLS